jgi:hypothetical protein
MIKFPEIEMAPCKTKKKKTSEQWAVWVGRELSSGGE